MNFMVTKKIEIELVLQLLVLKEKGQMPLVLGGQKMEIVNNKASKKGNRLTEFINN